MKESIFIVYDAITEDVCMDILESNEPETEAENKTSQYTISSDNLPTDIETHLYCSILNQLQEYKKHILMRLTCEEMNNHLTELSCPLGLSSFQIQTIFHECNKASIPPSYGIYSRYNICIFILSLSDTCITFPLLPDKPVYKCPIGTILIIPNRPIFQYTCLSESKKSTQLLVANIFTVSSNSTV
jgi:hypothetical protein